MGVPRTSRFRVSDHALLRFLERAGGCDVEALRETIEASLKRAVEHADKLGTANLIVVVDGLRYVVLNNVCVTVLTEDMPSALRVDPQ